MTLLDTDVCVAYLRGVPDVVAHLHRHLDEDVGVSFMTAAELFYGAAKAERRGNSFTRPKRSGEDAVTTAKAEIYLLLASLAKSSKSHKFIPPSAVIYRQPDAQAIIYKIYKISACKG